MMIDILSDTKYIFKNLIEMSDTKYSLKNVIEMSDKK